MLRYTIRPLTGWDGERTPPNSRRSRYAFKAGWSNTLDLLERELSHLDASEIVLQVDVRDRDVRNDGKLRADARPAKPGVRLLFDSRHGPLTYQADSCEFWQHNVRSIALGLEALRAVDRYGINAVQGQQYKGYREITAGPTATTREQAEHIIRAYAGDALAQLSLLYAYRRARNATHPDVQGGDRTAWDEVEAAARLLGLRGA